MPFQSSEELLAALVADNKVSERGELLLSSCLRIVATDQARKKPRGLEGGGSGACAGVGVGGVGGIGVGCTVAGK